MKNYVIIIINIAVGALSVQAADDWTQKTPSPKPSARRWHDMAYIGGDQALLFGGDVSNSYNNETWVYDLSADTWTQDSNTSQPSARCFHALSETSMDGSSYLVLFGGDDGAYDDETWTFGGGDYSLPVELSSFTASVNRSGAVILEWVTESEIENLGFLLERREESGSSSGSPNESGSTQSSDWQEIASYITDSRLQGQGSVTYRTDYSYTDNTVEIGKTYDYRLADVSYDGVKEYHSMTVMGVTVTEAIPDRFTVYQNYPQSFQCSDHYFLLYSQ